MGLGVETMTRKRRKFTDEFKAETVRLVNEGPRSLAEVARDLDLTESAVRNWVARADVDTGRREGITTSSAVRVYTSRCQSGVIPNSVPSSGS